MANKTGTPGNDTLTGTSSADQLLGLAGNDSLLGLGGNDRLEGGGGNDTLNGGIGIDTLIGGAGNDIYIVDNINDTVTEATNAGVDTVVSSISYTLGSNLDNLTLTGRGAINGTGNSLNNIITGNDGSNILRGELGNDTLDGSRGTDTMYGGDGDDVLLNHTVSYDGYDFGEGGEILYGGDGNDTLYGDPYGRQTFSDRYDDTGDTLYGGNGNDTYILVGSPDTITEATNAGIDTVVVSYSYTLRDNLENLTLTRNTFFSSSDGTGNSLNNTIIGNDGSNILKGELGNDNLNGGAGDDVLFGSSGGVGERDTLTGGVGSDIFFLGNTNEVFYDDRNRATAGRGDYALITDFNTTEDFIKLNGLRTDYRLAASPTGLPQGAAVYLNKPGTEPDELIAIVQGSTGLNLNGKYFRFSEFDLIDLNGSNGFQIRGTPSRYASGIDSVSDAGDVNGDGFDDLLIREGSYSGGNSAAYVVFGKAGGFGEGFNRFEINGITSTYNSADLSVSNAGDINGDGFDDLLIGGTDSSDGRYSYVVFGKASGFETSLNVSTLNGTNGFKINRSDLSVSEAGDVNGDGFDDFLLGDYTPNGFYGSDVDGPGQSYVVFGKAGGFHANLDLSTLNGNNGFKIDNGINFSGGNVSEAGDVNGDGFDDLLIGDVVADPNNQYNAGQSYVVFGKAGGFDANFNLSTLNGNNGFKINGINANDLSGRPISSAGDVNGDGFDDVIIGTFIADRYAQNAAGESYVVFGKATGFGASLNLSALNGNNGFVINGIDANDFFRWFRQFSR